MNQEQSLHQCAACGEQEAFLTYAVNALRRLCTDCLLKEHRNLFCPVCLHVHVTSPPPEQSILCLNCPSITHLACSSSSSADADEASSFTCPPCSDPNFSFFPKSHQNGAETVLGQESSNALVAAANISAVLMKNAAAELKKEAHEKIFAAKEAKQRAKEALGNLQELVRKQKALEKSSNPNPNKRKNSDR
ncbi:unnamed protein product [Eruca vesicaria subsp. sativa]|uniref:PHD-type domain-containing protein n=1 Tax=Eruca vesicaria subsp. sativa TaxID=29727 RepID=A0ABC8L5J0_ERUVS|nr:unnamed protein product [Eruca vesicaria subsp. sativa]